jgi:predicted amidohydrolase
MEKIIVASASVRNLVGQNEASIVNVDKWAAAAREQGAELILFPELNVSGYITAPAARAFAEPVPGPSTERIIAAARKREIIICFGIIEEEAGVLYCSQILVNGDGIIGKQRKIHVPVQEQPFWSAGNSIDVFDIGKARVGITICRDSFFDEMTRTLYFKGAEIVLMPFTYYNVPRSRFLKDSIHGMSIIKASWTNGYYAVFCNSAEGREPNEWEPEGRMFPGWAGIISPWGNVLQYINAEDNYESMVCVELGPEELADRRNHPNFLAGELRTELYQFK